MTLDLLASFARADFRGLWTEVFDHPLAGFLQRLKSLAHSRLLLQYPHPATRPKTSVKGRRKPAIAKDHGRFVVIVAHLGVAGGREGDDAEFAQGQSFRRSQRAGCRLARDRRVGLEVSAFAGVK